MQEKEKLMRTQSISLLGSTGSIGKNTLSVIALHPDKYHVFALTANTNAETLYQQCRKFSPRYVVISDPAKYKWLEDSIKQAGLNTEVLLGKEGLEYVASHKDVDTVIAAIVGIAGLASTLAAARQGKKILLANKEALVVAGSLLTDTCVANGARLLPVDSEHNAIFQCLFSGESAFDKVSKVNLDQLGVKKILLTGSGGPFRLRPIDSFSDITPDQACAHPNWNMGRKISVDSATMMNKGLELIEACWLFNCSHHLIEILLHPQSVVHSMVEYLDGSVIAQLGQPDMKTPIAHSLAWPERMTSGVESLNWAELKELTFESPCLKRFPALALAREVATRMGSASVVMNGANEVAVDAFLHSRLAFDEIIPLIQKCLEKLPVSEPATLDELQSLDEEVRAFATQCVNLNSATVSQTNHRQTN